VSDVSHTSIQPTLRGPPTHWDRSITYALDALQRCTSPARLTTSVTSTTSSSKIRHRTPAPFSRSSKDGTRHLNRPWTMLHPQQRLRGMNSENEQTYFCPIPRCAHSDTATTPFTSKLSLLRHLNTETHKQTHHLTNLSRCATLGIFHCCCKDCPSSPRTFFPSSRCLTIHKNASHPPSPHTIPTDSPTTHPLPPPSYTHIEAFAIASHTIHHYSSQHVLNHWEKGLSFISTTYDHELPDF
jgi:hypothetical protein